MQIAIIADIHGNLEAFEAVLDHIHTENVSHIFSLGDNVGYGPDPEAVMQRIRKEKILSVLGNHEMAMKNDTFISWFNPMAQKAVIYTRAHLSEESLGEIREYPKSRVFENLRFVHGAPPSSPLLYLFQLADDKLARCLDRLNESICFAGHTHDLHIIEYDGAQIERLPLPLGDTELNPKYKYVINVGSVGQPRDGDKRAKYVIYDTATFTVSVKAVAYDPRLTAEKIIQAGLPEQYASRLF
jgi:predicted phosphodiesterase